MDSLFLYRDLKFSRDNKKKAVLGLFSTKDKPIKDTLLTLSMFLRCMQSKIEQGFNFSASYLHPLDAI